MVVVNSGWIDFYEDEELFDLDPMCADDEPPIFTCNHEWIVTGSSPISGDIWVNCKKCDMPIEEYEKEVLKDAKSIAPHLFR